jgi:hypothetical protein
MPKTERGLPAGFELHVATKPVELGDYLDEAPAPVPTAKAPPAVAPPQPAVAPPLMEPMSAAELPATPPVASTAARPSGPPRKQFNMTPETLRMVDDLLIHLRTYSAERDVRASELFHALVLAVHEVRPFLDLSRIPPRGKWGSPSAAALPVALKEAFQDAIARYRERR